MNNITYYFRDLWYYSNENFKPIPAVPINDNAFPAFISVPIVGDEFEIPAFLTPYIYGAKCIGADNIIFSLVTGPDAVGRRVIHHKTINTILGTFRAASSTNMRLAHIITSKNVHYYGCRGLILDKDYNPLLVSTCQVRYYPRTNTFEMSNPKCKVSYKVFENSGELVEKTIIKQAIPYYASEVVPCYYGMVSCYHQELVETLITDLDYLVIKPAKPSIQESSPKQMNKTILSML